LSGFLEGFEDANREAAKAGDVFWAEPGTDAAAILGFRCPFLNPE